MLKRKIESKLELWWASTTSLFVNGARQVGKTFSLEQFAKSKTSNYIYINFIEKANSIKTLIKYFDVKSFLFNISLISDKPIMKNKTIVFLDEIQYIYEYMSEHNIPKSDFDLITLMKFLVADNSCRYILSGSLLGVTLLDVLSWPTGYMTTLTMYPLDFEEFLWANNIQQNIIDEVKDKFYNEKELDEYILNKFMDLFKKFILIGGMPQAVSNYINTNDINLVYLAHQNIEMYNVKDIIKHAPSDKKILIKTIYEYLPEELNKKNKRFSINLLKNKNNHQIQEDSFLWLINAGLAIPTYCIDEPIEPLKASVNRRLLKLFHEDSGLLLYSLMDNELREKILNNEKNVNFGSIYENIVAVLLRTHGYEELYYYNNKKYGEVDFIIKYKNKIIPLEIKSGKDYKTHIALNNLFNIKNYNIDEAFVFYNGNVKVKEKIKYFPIFMVDFLFNK